jgi:hypothetical protein
VSDTKLNVRISAGLTCLASFFLFISEIVAFSGKRSLHWGFHAIFVVVTLVFVFLWLILRHKYDEALFLEGW